MTLMNCWLKWRPKWGNAADEILQWVIITSMRLCDILQSECKVEPARSRLTGHRCVSVPLSPLRTYITDSVWLMVDTGSLQWRLGVCTKDIAGLHEELCPSVLPQANIHIPTVMIHPWDVQAIEQTDVIFSILILKRARWRSTWNLPVHGVDTYDYMALLGFVQEKVASFLPDFAIMVF